MSHYATSFQVYDEKTMARATGRDLSLSTKVAIEICNALRGRSVENAKKTLENTISMKIPIPYKRFTNAVGHRKGHMGPGRYPHKASSIILSLLESAEKNAQHKGLNSSSLKVLHICANRASQPSHHGRNRGKMKRAHLEIVVGELQETESKDQPKKDSKKNTKKTEGGKSQ